MSDGEARDSGADYCDLHVRTFAGPPDADQVGLDPPESADAWAPEAEPGGAWGNPGGEPPGLSQVPRGDGIPAPTRRRDRWIQPKVGTSPSAGPATGAR